MRWGNFTAPHFGQVAPVFAVRFLARVHGLMPLAVHLRQAARGQHPRRIAQVLISFCLTLPGAASAEIYRWTDEAGVVHFSQSLDGVPPRYREHVAVRCKP